MNHVELNEFNKSKMKSSLNDDIPHMDWVDDQIMDLLYGNLPNIRKTKEDTTECVGKLRITMSKYDSFMTNKQEFINEISKLINEIYKVNNTWYGISKEDIEETILLHRFCLINGEGGIGKSYFIFHLEEKLSQNNIPHLCVYGKYTKKVNDIDVDDIIQNSDKGFLFIVDAVNEMPTDEQEKLLSVIQEMKNNSRIRIIITYRHNSMEEIILRQYKNICSYEYSFGGVSFESTLEKLVEQNITNMYIYEDILYSNNALLLKSLQYALQSEKITTGKLNSIASITFLLENYIVNDMGKVIKNEDYILGFDIWKDVKEIAIWMYKNNTKYITESKIIEITKLKDKLIRIVLKSSLMDTYDNEHLFFTIDSLTDYLIGRSMYNHLKNKNINEVISIIKEKIEENWHLKTPATLVVMDMYAKNYDDAKRILSETKLILSKDILLKLVFLNKEDTIRFRDNFSPNYPEELLEAMGGYINKPFNCVNYLNNYYKKKEKQYIELSNVLSGHYGMSKLKNRLKSIVYYTVNKCINYEMLEEYLYFSLWCTASPNTELRHLATKLLYEVVRKNDRFITSLITIYDELYDNYIRESVVQVLSYMPKNKIEIIEFFENLKETDLELSDKSIKRISIYLNDEYGYINWERENRYRYIKHACISDELNKSLHRIELMHKDFLPFKYWGKDHVDMTFRFLNQDKHIVKKINDYLYENYSCVEYGDCNGRFAFEDAILNDKSICINREGLDISSFLVCYENILDPILAKYNVNHEYKANSAADFVNSLFVKCFDIAKGLYYASLMCNYYLQDFSSFNNTQHSIGYDVYDPLEFGEDVYITSPIAKTNYNIKSMNELIVNRMINLNRKDDIWAKDSEISRHNIVEMVTPITFNNEEWVLLAGRISLKEIKNGWYQWDDVYMVCCCTSKMKGIRNDGDARYLTIELEEYNGNIEDYKENKLNPFLCKSIKTIAYYDNIFDDTSLNLPPSDLIKKLNLSLDYQNMIWISESGEEAILCDNSKNSYYKDQCGGMIYIKKSFLDKYLQFNEFKHFGFSERYLEGLGKPDETAIHYEIINGEIVKEVLNNDVANLNDDINE